MSDMTTALLTMGRPSIRSLMMRESPEGLSFSRSVGRRSVAQRATASNEMRYLCVSSGAATSRCRLTGGGVASPSTARRRPPDGDLRASQGGGGCLPSPRAPRRSAGRTGPRRGCRASGAGGRAEARPLGRRRVRRWGYRQVIGGWAGGGINYEPAGAGASHGAGARRRGMCLSLSGIRGPSEGANFLPRLPRRGPDGWAATPRRGLLSPLSESHRSILLSDLGSGVDMCTDTP